MARPRDSEATAGYVDRREMTLHSKAFWTFVGAWVIGFLVGFAGAVIYERTRYAPEPPGTDAVHFDTSAVFLLSWLVVSVPGTALAIMRYLKARRDARHMA
jgi:uncharacterized membrane protein YhaH (DUF805 family)